MRKELLFDSQGVQVYRSSWGEGHGELPEAWQSDERPRVSFPETALLFGARDHADLVEPGGAVVLDAVREHGIRGPLPRVGRSLWIGLDPGVFAGLCGEETGGRVRRCAGRLVLESDARAALAVRALARSADAGTLEPVDAEALMYDVVGRVCRDHGSRPRRERDSVPGRHVDAVVHAIGLLQSCGGGMTLADVGREVHMSPHHFCRVFKRSTGMTVQGFRRRARLLRAADRVLKGGARLADIAHACGFSDQPHMTRAFTQVFGVSPARLARGSSRLEQMRRLVQDAGLGGS